MSRVLLGLGRLARQALAETSESLSCNSTGSVRNAHTNISQKYSPKPFQKEAPLDRSAGWMPKNPHIESWVFRRDKFEREFTWDKRNTFEMTYMMIGVTLGFWALSVWTIRHTDARSHYPKRDMLFAGSDTGFRLPDERDWH